MGLRILITDDDSNIVILIQRYLMENDISRDARISVCHSMEEVWRFFESGERVDIIFLDLVLLPLSALETIAMIPRLKPYCTRIVVVSGYEQYREAAMQAGATGYLNKLGDLDTTKNFWEKVAQFFRELGGPSEADKTLKKLSQSIKLPPHG